MLLVLIGRCHSSLPHTHTDVLTERVNDFTPMEAMWDIPEGMNESFTMGGRVQVCRHPTGVPRSYETAPP